MATLHPTGFTHGPHPKALRNMFAQPKAATDEYAVMIDTPRSAGGRRRGRPVERRGYVDSWRTADAMPRRAADRARTPAATTPGTDGARR